MQIDGPALEHALSQATEGREARETIAIHLAQGALREAAPGELAFPPEPPPTATEADGTWTVTGRTTAGTAYRVDLELASGSAATHVGDVDTRLLRMEVDGDVLLDSSR